MDPNETWRLFENAVNEGCLCLLARSGGNDIWDDEILKYRNIAKEHYENIRSWVSHGGFLPNGFDPKTVNKFDNLDSISILIESRKDAKAPFITERN